MMVHHHSWWMEHTIHKTRLWLITANKTVLVVVMVHERRMGHHLYHAVISVMVISFITRRKREGGGEGEIRTSNQWE